MAKYEKGRRCLIISSNNPPEMTGKIIILGDRAMSVWDPIRKQRIDSPSNWWGSDPPTRTNMSEGRQIVWPERHLLPLDDPDNEITKELQNELLETKPKELAQEAESTFAPE